jgi:hypothetical protein
LRLLYFVSAYCDNWFYFGRIGVYKWKDDAQMTAVSRCGTLATIICYTMELCKEVTDANTKAHGNVSKMAAILYSRRWFIVMKLFEFPI